MSTQAQQDWWLFQRVQDVNSALKVNIVRAIAIVVYYAIHLANYLSLDDATDATRQFHWNATLIFISGLLIVAAIFLAYYLRHLPPYAKFVSTSVDIALVVAAAAIGDRANSWLVVIFLLIIATTYLRFNMRLVLFATILSAAGYLALVGMSDPIWFDQNHATPVRQQAMVLAAILLTGVVGLQICRSCQSWILSRK